MAPEESWGVQTPPSPPPVALPLHVLRTNASSVLNFKLFISPSTTSLHVFSLGLEPSTFDRKINTFLYAITVIIS